jgi:molecular chaperone GrpE
MGGIHAVLEKECAMRRKIRITEHGVEHADEHTDDHNGAEDTVATGDPATDPLGEQVAADPTAEPADQPVSSTSALEDRVADLEAQLKAEHDQNLRTLAEFQNFRRRMEEENRRYAAFANEELVRTFLPILDNFERALAAAEKNQSFEALMGGVALTHRQLLDLLKKTGVEPIETKGKSFDPNFHEAVERVSETEEPENTIVQELQRGYMMNSRVLRPSLVKVAGG